VGEITSIEIVEFGVQFPEVAEVGGGGFNEEGSVPVGLRVPGVGRACQFEERVSQVGYHSTIAKPSD
jgi:hypothetical protein